ncbi:MAG: penicillin-binding transpeptidase domain-containing protein [Eubacteriales bacterium]|nr:penicillin-binding transpeptidase domain-containing protein [Eubacteriales bacterium]
MAKTKNNYRKKISKKELRDQIGARSVGLFMIFFVAFVILLFNLLRIIWQDGDTFRQRVLSQAIQREGDSYIEFKRGDIKDRNGIVLAGTKQIYKLIFDPKLINKEVEEDKSGQKRKTILKNITLKLLEKNGIRTQSELENLLREKKNFNYIVLEKEMEFEDFKEIKEVIDDSKALVHFWEKEIKEEGMSEEAVDNMKNWLEKSRALGIFYEVHHKRKYPYPTLAPELIGFVKKDNKGEGGIEEYYNEMLIGEVGRKYGVLDSNTIAVDKEVDATDGYQIMLNIDYSIQKYITDAMNDYLKDHNPKSVTIVVADPRNMNILGLKSYPSFSQDSPYEIEDLELPADVEIVEKSINAIILERKKELLKVRIEEVEAERERLAQEQASTIPLPTLEEIKDEEVITEEERASMRKNLLLQNRWKNIALTNGYEPGSIFKAITYAVGAEENKFNEDNFHYCKGGLQVANHYIRCNKLSGHATQTAEQGLSNSCNVVFMNIGANIGRDLFYNYQHKFGFGSLTGIDLAGETSQRKNIYSKEELNEVQLATSSFGQGFNVTPIQMITAFSALINGGNLYEPHVVHKIFDKDGNLFEVKDKTLIRQVVSEETSHKIRHALKGVVDEGTGRAAKIAGYEIGGKTATSEKQPRGNGKYTVSFMGFAPIENPEVITLVIVDEPEGAYQDSRIPSVIFRNCMENIMPYLHIFKAESAEEK